MPYIKPADRKPLDPLIDQLAALLPEKDFAGSLNYVITRLCDAMLRRRKNYGRINEVVGALECARLEFYRRVAAPYEDAKIAENGDAYES
ncbi:MAG: hypothetical protein HS108_07480 [Planctomycetes bacterium]|jgi:hypothetical protein|nr:hypothetical protein [Planctomycetota bacterium]MCL4731123.1 hypothetical protein [Planctomycetota bacterium]